MPPGAISFYIQSVVSALESENGNSLAKLLSFNRQFTKRYKDELLDASLFTDFNLSIPHVDPQWSDIVAASLKIHKEYLLNNSLWTGQAAVEASADQINLVQNIHTAFQNLTRWAIPVVVLVNRELRIISIAADKTLVENGQKAVKVEETVRTTYKALTCCLTDRFSEPAQSRKWGVYAMTNLLFRLYFRLETTNLCKNVLKAIDASGTFNLDQYPMSDQVEFAYYQGILAFMNERYDLAEKELQFSFENCLPAHLVNKTRVLAFLIPLKMIKGVLPTKKLFDKYSKKIKNTQFTLTDLYLPIVNSIRSGNISLFDDLQRELEMKWMKLGTFFLVEKLRFIVLRELFRRVWLLNGKVNKIPMDKFRVAFNASIQYTTGDAPVDLDEIECLLANLIDKGLLKGYLSHELKFVVLSLKDPWPLIKGL